MRAAADMVAAGTDHVDLLINNAGVMTPTGTATSGRSRTMSEMHRLFRVNALGPLRVVEALLPLLERAETKRLCFVSSEAGSINRAERHSWFGYCSSKAALNMGVRLLFNRLRPRGYTFRLYHPGWMRSYMSGPKNIIADMEPEEAAVPALAISCATAPTTRTWRIGTTRIAWCSATGAASSGRSSGERYAVTMLTGCAIMTPARSRQVWCSCEQGGAP